LDICDGIFVPNRTWPFNSGGMEDFDFQNILNEQEGMPFWDEFDFEIDLLTVDAIENFNSYIKLGPKRIIFHLSAQKNLEEFENFLDSLDMYIRDNTEIGLAFKPSDDLKIVLKFANKVDFLQCMGADKMGFQGEPLSEKVFENIEILQKELPGIILSVDIGVNLENAPRLIKAGVNRLVVGSGIWKNINPLGALEDFQKLL
jgi:ribulose-phosphate 3-epimerase